MELKSSSKLQYTKYNNGPLFLLHDTIQLLSARDMAQRTVIGQDQIVYSTDRDLLEQDYEAREWDRRFREIEKSD